MGGSSAATAKVKPWVPNKYPKWSIFFREKSIFLRAAGLSWLFLGVYSAVPHDVVLPWYVLALWFLSGPVLVAVPILWRSWVPESAASIEASLSALTSQKLSEAQDEIHDQWWRHEPVYRAYCDQLLWLRGHPYSRFGIYVPAEEDLRHSVLGRDLVQECLTLAQDLQSASLTLENLSSIQKGQQRLSEIRSLLEGPTIISANMQKLSINVDEESRQLEHQLITASRVEAERLLEQFATYVVGQVSASEEYSTFVAEHEQELAALNSSERALKRTMQLLISDLHQTSPRLD